MNRTRATLKLTCKNKLPARNASVAASSPASRHWGRNAALLATKGAVWYRSHNSPSMKTAAAPAINLFPGVLNCDKRHRCSSVNCSGFIATARMLKMEKGRLHCIHNTGAMPTTATKDISTHPGDTGSPTARNRQHASKQIGTAANPAR